MSTLSLFPQPLCFMPQLFATVCRSNFVRHYRRAVAADPANALILRTIPCYADIFEQYATFRSLSAGSVAPRSRSQLCRVALAEQVRV